MSDITIVPYHGSFLMPSLERATVADAMHPGILCCEPDASPTDVARMMASQHVHCVVVMGVTHEPSGESLAWGLISDLDLLRGGVGAGALETADALAGQPIITVTPTTPLREAAALMLSHRISHLVVIDEARLLPIGTLSTLDIAGVLAWGEA